MTSWRNRRIRFTYEIECVHFVCKRSENKSRMSREIHIRIQRTITRMSMSYSTYKGRFVQVPRSIVIRLKSYDTRTVKDVRLKNRMIERRINRTTPHKTSENAYYYALSAFKRIYSANVFLNVPFAMACK